MTFLKQINLFMWGGPMMILLLGTHIYFTFRLGFVQRHIFRALTLSVSNISTLTTTLAATLGTGNIIGIGTAVYFGGPGAVFWCWITGLAGMATTYAEGYLSYQYKDREHHVGGPMILLRDVLKKKHLAVLYAAAICCAAFCVGAMTQSNAITLITSSVSGIPSSVVGMIVVILTGLVIVRNVTIIESICQKLVPAMGFFFLGGCFLLVVLGYEYLLPALSAIGKGAFSFQSFGSGVLGYTVSRAIRFGVARGLYTNEAGLGTAGIIAAGSHATDVSIANDTPRTKALVSMCATFFDTVILCAVTGIAITIFLLQHPDLIPQIQSGQLTLAAFSTLPFYGMEIMFLSTIAFALATLIGWSYIGHSAAFFLGKKTGVSLYKMFYLIFIFIGAVSSLDFIWELSDLINLCLALPCLYTLIRLRKNVCG
ncbi:MAG: amino acid carrier protein [Lachnoclostridium sp.]|jgi:AGCS family alanine or glycine:cation symporter|nr:amino acid carrier protein [Lachnoclostridium sp.]